MKLLPWMVGFNLAATIGIIFLLLLPWMVGFNLAATIGIIFLLLRH